ncbi:hypothetical protein [Altibacter lentus]|uniref:hypothetical protein n=1 Tax=Altibacter lentus TaxID=1223410 RepID=UPI000555CD71|nr:hypothetical protein [Altibacter lentus]
METKKKNKLKYNSEITEHDKTILRQEHVHGDGGDDQQLKERKRDVDFAGSDLDIPGRDQAKKGQGPLGLKDEENKHHSQGGDTKNNLKRDDSAL